MILRVLILTFFAAIMGCIQIERTDPVVAVAADKMNVLMLGIKNPVTIAVSEEPGSDIGVQIDNGEIKGDNGKYIVRPASTGVAIITVSKGDEILGKAKFRVEKISPPVAVVAGKGDVLIKKSLLLKQEILEVDPQTCYDISYSIKSFTVTVLDGEWDRSESSEGNRFTDEQKELIKSQTTGKKVYINNILLVSPDGKVRKVPSIILTIDKE